MGVEQGGEARERIGRGAEASRRTEVVLVEGETEPARSLGGSEGLESPEALYAARAEAVPASVSVHEAPVEGAHGGRHGEHSVLLAGSQALVGPLELGPVVRDQRESQAGALPEE